MEYPTKPPRGVKIPKETSGLLMSVIRTLSITESNEQREQERAKLEREYKKSNQQLEELVGNHHHDLTAVMKLFTKFSEIISETHEKVRSTKDTLVSCKSLLTCQREELKRLWIEGMQYKRALEMLEQVDEITKSPIIITDFICNNRYLDAAKLIVEMCDTLDVAFAEVTGLQELKDELLTKKQELQEKLLREIKDQIYSQNMNELMLLKRQGSLRDTPSPMQRLLDRKRSLRYSRVKRMLPFSNAANYKDGNRLNVESDATTNEDYTTLGNLAECIILLNAVQEALEDIGQSVQRELLSLASRTTEELIEMSPPNILSEFFYTLTDQFRNTLECYKFLVNTFSAKVACKIDLSEIWLKMQSAMQIILTYYLDIHNLEVEENSGVNASDAFSNRFDINSFFARKKYTRVVKGRLFKFENIRAGKLILHSKETPDEEEGWKNILVCKASSQNIIVIYAPVVEFADEIEQSISNSSQRCGGVCRLTNFVNDYVRDVFLERHGNKIAESVDTITSNGDSWHAFKDSYNRQKLSIPLLQNVVGIAELLSEVFELMRSFPSHREHFLSVINQTLTSFREMCKSRYRSLLHSVDNRQSVPRSVLWLKDTELTSYLKSLPNWLELKCVTEGVTSDRNKGKLIKESSWVKEADTLIKIIGDVGVASNEIISEITRMKYIAQLQVSLEWFSTIAVQLSNNLRVDYPSSPNTPIIAIASDQNTRLSPPPLASNSGIHTMRNLCAEFADLADNCLLILHLEVRVQCFHYLWPKGVIRSKMKSGDRHDPDPRVLELSRTLSSMDEALSGCFQHKKSKFIFEGIGTLITRILLRWARVMDYMDEILVRKICRNIYALQQTLCSISGSKNSSLDSAKQYFQLFLLSPEEILKSIEDKSPEFSEKEYANVLQLIHQCRPDYSDQKLLQQHLNGLSRLFGEKGVIV